MFWNKELDDFGKQLWRTFFRDLNTRRNNFTLFHIISNSRSDTRHSFYFLDLSYWVLFSPANTCYFLTRVSPLTHPLWHRILLFLNLFWGLLNRWHWNNEKTHFKTKKTPLYSSSFKKLEVDMCSSPFWSYPSLLTPLLYPTVVWLWSR